MYRHYEKPFSSKSDISTHYFSSRIKSFSVTLKNLLYVIMCEKKEKA